MMALKRKMSSNGTSKALCSSRHPALRQVARANASDTREHSESYHDFQRYCRLPSMSLLFIADLVPDDIAKDFNQPLLAWYGKRGDLPWRSDLSDEQIAAMSEEQKAQRAYEVWVSEIMLQQTQVATVIPYYNRWIAAFPTVQSLAKADIETVNSIWKGLGYYSRASRLLDGAKTVVKTFKGKLPSEPEVLVKQIEGIGPYTAGAIASIAYGVKAATVDGNIQRVICRLLAIYADMKKKATNDYIWQVAEKLVPEARAGHWNQALMDLGATICTPKNPRCGECPLNQACLAYAEVCVSNNPSLLRDIEDMPSSKKSKGEPCDLCVPLDPPASERDVTLYPLKVVKKKSRDEDIAVCVVEWQAAGTSDQTKVLLVKRPKTGLLAGLDEFPSVVMPEAESTASDRVASSLELLNELLDLPPKFSLKSSAEYTSLTVSGVSDLGSIRHIYSHINATFLCRRVVMSSDAPPRIRADKGKCRWVTKDEVAKANISTGAAKIWDLVLGKTPKGQPKAKKASSKTPEAKGNIGSFFKKRETATKKESPVRQESEVTEEETPRSRKKRIIIESDED